MDIVIALAVSFVIGLFIFFIYRKTFKGVMYSTGFGVSILAITLITTLIILAITSNIVLSLEMAGALSIVRFRTAAKEPLDIAFMFWAYLCRYCSRIRTDSFSHCRFYSDWGNTI